MLRGDFYDAANNTWFSPAGKTPDSIGVGAPHLLWNDHVERSSYGFVHWKPEHALGSSIPVQYMSISISNDHCVW
jgi:hypothetical protein